MTGTALTGSRALASDGLQVDVLEGRRQDAHAVDALAGGDELRDEARGVLPVRALEAAHSSVHLDLHPLRSLQLGRDSGGDDLSLPQDRDPVADELDLAEQVRVEEDGDTAAAQLLEQPTHDAAADGVESARRLVEEDEPGRADERLGDSEPLLHPFR